MRSLRNILPIVKYINPGGVMERAVFNEELRQWHREGEHPFEGVTASSYPEAFEKLFGHPMLIPPPRRTPRRNQEEV